MQVSIIIPCKNRLNHLLRGLRFIMRLNAEVVVVDYNCPQNTHLFAEKMGAKAIKVDVGEREWNLSAARNIGYRNSTGDILCFLDADTIIKPEFSNITLKKGEFISGTIRQASGCCMVWRTDFEKVKGYNEVVEGWGSEDLDLYDRLKGIGLTQRYWNDAIYNLSHSHKLRNQYHGHKPIMETNNKNHLTMQKEFKGL